MEKSLLDLAYDIIERRHKASKKKSIDPIPFYELWQEVLQEREIAPDELQKIIGYFYTNLILDGRFVSRSDNTWDLRQYYTLEEMSENNDFYHDDFEEYEEEETKPEGVDDDEELPLGEEDELDEDSEAPIVDLDELDF